MKPQKSRNDKRLVSSSQNKQDVKDFKYVKTQTQNSGQDNQVNLKRKKVAFILPSLSPGGAERVLITLMNHLDRTRFDPVFIVISGAGEMKAWISPEIPYYELQYAKTSQSYFSLLFRLKKIKPDVVFTTMVHSNALTLFLKPFFPKTKFIIRESSMPTALMKDYYGWKGKVCGYVYRFLYPYADLVLSPTMRIIDEFKNDLQISMRNHKILYNPVDMKTISQNIAGDFEVEKSTAKTLRFVSMGRLSFEKGFDRLIEAMPHLKTKYDWRLDILGEGPQRPDLEKLIKKYDLEDKVFLRGYQKDPWRCIAQADCLILPSRWEGMPNVALESLACGTKVLAMKEAGGIIEIDSMTPRAAVRTFKTMNEMLEALADVKPLAKKKAAESLLPEQFSLDYIMQDFQGFLE